MEYVGLAGGMADDGGGAGFDVQAWAPYIGGGFVVLLLVVMFVTRR